MKRFFAAAVVTVAIAGPGQAGEAKAPLVLAPSSDWTVTYANDSCRLARTFGKDGDKTSLSFDRFEPGDDLMLIIGSHRLDGLKPSRTTLRFGPGSHGEVHGLDVAYLQDLTPALYTTSTQLHQPAETSATRAGASIPPVPGLQIERMQYRVDPAIEASINWLEVTSKGKPVMRLNLGSMAKPMAEMRTCTDELLTHWGIDLAAHRQLTKPAIPASNPGTWLNSSDYPAGALIDRQPGLVQVRMSVGPDGVPTQCHIQQSSRGQGFDSAVCRGLMRRARFEPALGADGQAIASYWRTSVRFAVN